MAKIPEGNRGTFQSPLGGNKAPRVSWGLGLAEPVICAGANRHTPCLSSNAWLPGEAAEEIDGLECQGEARGQSWGQENQRAREETGEMAEALPGWEEGKGRRGRLRAKARCRGTGKMESRNTIMEWGIRELWIL